MSAWTLIHRGDPCVLCGKRTAEQEPGGCSVTLAELWSRVGQLGDASAAEWCSGDEVEARRLGEEAKRLERLHRVLRTDMAPAGGTP